MSVEISLVVDGRTVMLDIEPHTLQALKSEFNEFCDEDEALKRRRQTWAPTYCMSGNDNVLKELKRKHIFKGRETVVIKWIPLELEASSIPSKEIANSKAEDEMHTGSNKVVTSQSEKSEQNKQSEVLDKKNNKEQNYSEVEGKEKDNEISDDSEDYGLVREYFTDEQWKKMPKYQKLREKNRFELREIQLKQGLVKGPYQPEKLNDTFSSSSNSPSPTSKRNASRGSSTNFSTLKTSNTGEKRKVSTDSEFSFSSDSRTDSHSDTDSNKESNRTTKVLQGQRQDGMNQSKTSTSRSENNFLDKSEVKKMKPHLPLYNIPKVLEKIKKKANDQVQETIQNLNENGILTGNPRKLLIRILVRHLYFKIGKDPKQVTPDMKEGLAKSIVMEYPKFQELCDGKTTFPWKSLFDRQGRGWIANAARAIQKKYRTKKSVKKRRKDSSHNVHSENNEVSETEVQALALLMPGRAEKTEILERMKDTFPLRQEARSRQDSVRQMLERFPHLANYDGEVLQEEFKLLRPDAQDMSLNFQQKMPNILAIGTTDNATLPIENDVLKALLIMSQKLPRDIRNRSDPKMKSTKADLHDIVEIVQLGQDIDAFVAEKATNADGPIQPYIVMVKSPVRSSIVKCFLILDQKPVQLSTTSVLKSLELLLKSYFIFNVQYPLGWRRVFHCLATCFAHVFEDQGQGKRADSTTPSERDLMNMIKNSST